MPSSEIHTTVRIESVDNPSFKNRGNFNSVSQTDNHIVAQHRQALTMPTEFGQCQIVDNRSVGQTLLDFGAAAVHRATDAQGWKHWASHEQQKFQGIGEGLTAAKEDVKKAAVSAATSIVDGRAAHAVIHAPEALKSAASACVHAAEAIAHDPHAPEHAVQALSGMIQKASADYSALSPREQGKVIGHAMFAAVNPEGSTEAGAIAMKAADNIATHVDAAVVTGIQKSINAIEDMAKSSPELAQHAKQMLFDYTNNLRLTPKELQAAGVPKGFLKEFKIPSEHPPHDLYNAITDGKGYRGDHDLYSRLNEKLRPKSYINEHGDMTPANIEGMYKERKVTLAEHLNARFCKAQKAQSPYTSWGRDKDHVIAKFGKDWVELDLAGLKKEMAEGKVPGVKTIHDTDAIIQSVEGHPTFPPRVKKTLIGCATRDNEFMVEGVIPQRFLKVRGK